MPYDPIDDLYQSKREALDTGKHLGAADAISRARAALSIISGKYETAGDDEGFRVAEECCAALRSIAIMIEADRERGRAGGNLS